MQIKQHAGSVRELRVLNLGAGVQSTTLYLMALTGELHFDIAIFADVQEEPADVYRHLEWLKTLGGPPIIERTKGRLGDHILQGKNSTGNNFISIPAFTAAPDGKRGMVRRQCSKEYKIEVIELAIRRDLLGLKPKMRIPRAVSVTQIIGISLDEGGRAARIQRNAERNKSRFKYEFPLIDRFMTRTNCLDWLARFGIPHKCPRSACSFCPYHSDYEWSRIQANDPDAWNRAVQIDRALRTPGIVTNRNRDQLLYLHSSLRPLEDVVFNVSPDPRAQQIALNFARECLGVCGN